MHNENGISISKMNSKTSALNIDVLKDNHRGVFKCVAKNQAGHADIESRLFINGISDLMIRSCKKNVVFGFLIILLNYFRSLKFLPRSCHLISVTECPTLKIVQPHNAWCPKEIYL